MKGDSKIVDSFWEQTGDVRKPKPRYTKRTVDPKNFLETVSVNVDNKDLSDADFREFIRNTLPIVSYRED